MATTIVTKKGSGAPAASDLVEGELAVDTTNGRLYTENSSAAVVELGSNPSGNITFADDGKAIFGADSDLQIYHDGSNSIITDGGTGSLLVRGSNVWIQNADGSETGARFITDGAIDLRYDNAIKLATTSTGIDVTGTATMDGLTVNGVGSFSSAAPYIDLFETDTTDVNSRIVSNSSSLRLQTVGDNGSGATNRLLIDHTTGDISFYEDTGTTAKLVWDASAESLGIGTDSPSGVLHLRDTTPHLYIQSDDGQSSKLLFGDATDNSRGGFEYTSSDAMTFMTNNLSEKMRIDSSGNWMLGTTDSSLYTSSTENGLFITSSGQLRNSTNAVSAYFNRTGSDGTIVQFNKDGTSVGSVSVTASATSYNTSSDQRLKENIADADDAGSKVDAIQVRKFDWKADGSHQDYGMIAQELIEVAPEAVSAPEDPEEMMGVDYSKLVPMLIKEIQQLRQRVAQLEE